MKKVSRYVLVFLTIAIQMMVFPGMAFAQQAPALPFPSHTPSARQSDGGSWIAESFSESLDRQLVEEIESEERYRGRVLMFEPDIPFPGGNADARRRREQNDQMWRNWIAEDPEMKAGCIDILYGGVEEEIGGMAEQCRRWYHSSDAMTLELDAIYLPPQEEPACFGAAVQHDPVEQWLTCEIVWYLALPQYQDILEQLGYRQILQAEVAPAEVQVAVISLPDLVIDSVRFDADRHEQEVVVRNAGDTGSVAPPFFTEISWIEDPSNAHPEIQAFPHVLALPTQLDGTHWQFRVRSNGNEYPPEGAVAFRVVVDPDNRVGETNENNNTASRAPFADFALSDVRFDPQALHFTMTVQDRSAIGSDTAPSYEMAFVDQNNVVVGTPWRDVAYGAAGSNTWTADLAFPSMPDGAVAFHVTVDPDNQIREMNEENNRVTRIFLPDLSVLTNQGQGDVHDIVIVNGNPAVAPQGTVQVRLAWQRQTGQGRAFRSSETLSEQTVDADVITAGRTWRASIALPRPDGATFCTVTVDPNNVLSDADRQNNSALSDCGVSAPVAPSDSPSILPEDTVRGHAGRLLPDNPFYFLEEMGRAISMALTFGNDRDAQRAQRSIQYAEDIFAESEAVSQKGNTELAERHIEKGIDYLDRARKGADKVREKNKNDADDIVYYIFKAYAKNKDIVDTIERKLTGDELARYGKTEERMKDTVGKALSSTDDAAATDRIVRRVAETSDKKSEHVLKSIEVLESVASHVGNARAKAVIEQNARKMAGDASDVIQTLDKQQTDTFMNYLAAAPGKSADRALALQAVVRYATEEKAKTIANDVLTMVIDMIETRIEQEKQNTGAIKTVLAPVVKQHSVAGAATLERIRASEKKKSSASQTDDALNAFVRAVEELKKELGKGTRAPVDAKDLYRAVDEKGKDVTESMLFVEKDSILHPVGKESVMVEKDSILMPKAGTFVEKDSILTPKDGTISVEKDSILTPTNPTTKDGTISVEKDSILTPKTGGTTAVEKDSILTPKTIAPNTSVTVEKDSILQPTETTPSTVTTQTTCPMTNAPVCGIDGRTYVNSCLAEKARMLYAPGSCEATTPDTAELMIFITDKGFKPSSLTVTPGVIIRFVNDSAHSQAIVGDAKTTEIKPGASVRIGMPDVKGSYQYMSSFNSLLKGEIVVK